MGKDETAKKQAVSGGSVEVGKMSKQQDPPVAMASGAAVSQGTLEASKRHRDMKESKKGSTDPPTSAPGLTASVQNRTASVATSRVRGGGAAPLDTTDVPLTRRPTADESRTLAPPQRPMNTSVGSRSTTITSTTASSSSFVSSSSPAPVALGRRPTVDDSASLAPPQQPSSSTATLRRPTEDAASVSPPMTSSFPAVSMTSTATTAVAGVHRRSTVSQPGAFRIDGIEPSEHDDIRDDITVPLGDDNANGAQGGATLSSSSSSASGNSNNNNNMVSTEASSGRATPPEVTAYLVTEEETNSQSSSNAEELRNQIEALSQSVQQLAQQTAEQQQQQQQNNNNHIIVVAEPMEDTTTANETEHDNNQDDSEPELNPNRRSALASRGASNVTASMSSSSGRTSNQHLQRDASLASNMMHHSSSTSNNMDGSMSNTMDAASASQIGLVVALREDRDARQQERVARAEQRASKRQERKQAQRRKNCLWNLLYLTIAAVLGVTVYLIFQSGVADSALEKLDGATDEAQNALDDLSAGAAPTPAPEITTGTLFPTTIDDATAETAGGGGNNSTDPTIDNTNSTTATTTTRTTGGDTPMLNSDTLPGVLAGGLATGAFLLMMACSCTTRRKITREGASTVHDLDLDAV